MGILKIWLAAFSLLYISIISEYFALSPTIIHGLKVRFGGLKGLVIRMDDMINDEREDFADYGSIRTKKGTEPLD